MTGKLVVFIYSQMPDFKEKSGFGEKSVPKFPEKADINNPETLPPYVKVLEKLGDRVSLQKYPGSTEFHRFKVSSDDAEFRVNICQGSSK